MYTFLLVLLAIDSVILIAVILMQAGQGGGLASLGGGTASQVLGGRQATTVLTKATWITGGAFMVLALMLSAMSTTQRGTGGSDVQKALQQGAAPLPPVTPATNGSAADLLKNAKPDSSAPAPTPHPSGKKP